MKPNPSLLARAQALRQARTAAGSTLAIATLATAAAAQAGIMSTNIAPPAAGALFTVESSYNGVSGGVYGSANGNNGAFNGAGFSLSANSVNITVDGSPTSVVRVGGQLISLTGATFDGFGGSSVTYRMTLQGFLPNTVTAGNFFFGADIANFTTGGAVALNAISFVAGGNSFNPGAPGTLSGLTNISFTSPNFTDITDFSFSVTLDFTWSGYLSADILSLDLDNFTRPAGLLPGLDAFSPIGGLNFGISPISAIPEPATVAVGLGSAVLATWTILARRRRQTVVPVRS